MGESLLLMEDAQGSPRSLHAYRSLSYARTRVRVRFIVVVGGCTVTNGGITVVEGGCIVALGDLPIL